MEISKEKIMELGLNNFFDQILPIIEKTYKKNIYLGLSFEQYTELVKERLIHSIRVLVPDKKITDSFVKGEIDFTINRYIRQKLETEDSISLINRYIDESINRSDDYKTTLKQFKKLSNFFQKARFIPNPDLCVELIKRNETLNQILNDIVQKNIVTIKKGNIEEVFSDSLQTIFLETYCVLHNIIEDDFINSGKGYETTNTNIEPDLRFINVYLRDINFPILNKQEEIFLAQRMANGDFLARQTLIERNLIFVVSLAKRFVGKGLPFFDLIQEGNVGLLKAVDKFDVSKGYRLSTYAAWWIKYFMITALKRNSTVVRIPDDAYDKIRLHLKRTNRELSVEDIKQLFKATPEKAINIYMCYKKPVSMYSKLSDIKEKLNVSYGDYKLGIDEDTNMDNDIGNLILSNEEAVEDTIISNEIMREIEGLFNSPILTSSEATVLKLRYGFNGKSPMALDMIGAKFGVSRETIRNIEGKALKKIRSLTYIDKFASYIGNHTVNLQRLESFRRLYEKQDNKVRKTKTIYQLLGYPKEIVDAFLETLSDKDKQLITMRYGDDLEHPNPSKEWDIPTTKHRYERLVRKMRKKLVVYESNYNYNSKTKIQDNQINGWGVFMRNNSLETLKSKILKQISEEFNYREAVTACVRTALTDDKASSEDSKTIQFVIKK